MKIYRATETERTYLIARELAVDAVSRICRAREPVPKPETGYHTCPTCGGLLTEEYQHCRWCGQRLAWPNKN